jgi:DNA-binding NarL/FixJ family response regulator
MMQQHAEPTEMAKVLLVDDFPLRRAAIAAFLERWTTISRLMLDQATEWPPSGDQDYTNLKLIIVSVGGFPSEDFEVAEKLVAIRAWSPSCPIVVLSDSGDTSAVLRALKLGVQGFIPTQLDPHIAIEAMKFVFAGGVFFPPSALVNRPANEESFSSETGKNLTARQAEVIELLQRGKSNKVIARELGMQESTVKVHVRQIMRKLGVANRTQAALHVRGGTPVDDLPKSSTPIPALTIKTGTAAARRYFP